MSHPEEDRLERAIRKDLDAFQEATSRRMPDVHETVRRLRERPPTTHQERIMATMRKRSWIAPLGAATALAALLVLVPVSYEKTVGHDVTLTVPGSHGGALEQDVAGRLAEVLEASGGVKVLASPGARTFQVRSPLRSRSEVNVAVASLTGALSERGIPARADIAPAVELVSGNVWAFAGDRVLDITVRHGSAGEMEDQIRRQLADAGMADADVAVDVDGDRTKIEIRAESDGSALPAGEMVIDLERVGGDGSDEIRIRAPMDIEREPGMTDDDYRNAIVEHLADQGIEDAQVTVDGNEVQVEVQKRVER